MSIGKKRVYTNYFRDIIVDCNNTAIIKEFGHFYFKKIFNLHQIYN